MRTASDNRRGMTVFELALALLLFGILSAFVMQVMNSVINLWQSGERRGQGDLVFAAAVERFRGDLNALHTGNRGWLILDEWEARGATEGVASWYLPRIRFLADGASLPDVDPSRREPVEVMWTVVPEDPTSRFGRLVRFTNIEDPQRTLRDSGTINEMIRNGEGLTVMDGVLWTEFLATDTDGQLSRTLRIDSEMPYDFPSQIDLTIEMVSGNARKQPANLDNPVEIEPEIVRLRGIAPIRVPEYALLGNEWVRVDGTFPNLRFSARGARASLPAPQQARTPVYLPSRYQSTNRVAVDGRRLR